MTLASPWWDPAVYADRRPFLRHRAHLTAATRAFFAARDFCEVETAQLQVSPGNETHLHAVATALHDADGATHQMHLHTSPEFAMKKLLAAGESRIVTLARVFRNRERGALHHPEFTMLEWYRSGADYTELMADCAALLAMAAEVTGSRVWQWRGQTADPCAAPERLSVADAFTRHAGLDLLATLLPDGRPDRIALALAAREIGVAYAEDDDWSDIVSRILVERVEPHLGCGWPTILDRYPVSEAALARPCPDDPRLAERFELYVCGVELANGFGELVDAAEQRRRFEAQMDERERRYGHRYPIDPDFLAALAVMPPASGIALGFDRLVMLATGAVAIEQVLWTPVQA